MTKADWAKDFGVRLYKKLEYCNMTQQELAKDIGVSQATISNYIKGVCVPTIVNFINICYSLDCDASDLAYTYDLIIEG